MSLEKEVRMNMQEQSVLHKWRCLLNKLQVFTFSENVIMKVKDIQKQSTVS